MEDFIPFYPDLSANDAQIVLNSLAEFRELTSQPGTEKRATPGTYYKIQEVVARLLRILNRMFIIHEPGVGKSCTITATIELIKDITNLFQNVYIVTYSSLTDAMKYQIICKCTNNKYINDKGRSGAKVSEVRASTKKSFTDNYTLESYDKFNKRLIGKTADELRRDYGYSFICVDEVTKLITTDFSPSITSMNKPNGAISWIENRIDPDILMLKDIRNLDDPRIINSEISYIQYWRLFHIIGDLSKVIIASGTPSNNRPSEIFLLANLLLPLDRQIDVQLFANNVFVYNLRKYENYFNNLFSFVKSSNIVAKANYKGNSLGHKYLVEFPEDDTSVNPNIIVKEFKSQYVLYKVELFGYQADKLFTFKDDNASNSINNVVEQMICYVDYTKRTGRDANRDQITLNSLTIPGIEGLNRRMNSCGLFTEIVRIEEDAYNKAIKAGKPGPGLCFNYIPLAETVVGSLKKSFEIKGYEILEDFSAFKEVGGDFCNVSNVTFKGLLKKKRAVFLTGGPSTDVHIRNLILQVAGSPDNVYGEYIQFLDGSEVMGIGINTKNALRFIRPINEWNEAKDKQSRDRVFREDAHDEYRNVLANEVLERTGIRPNPYDLDVEVDVYNMCGFCRYYYIGNDKISLLPSTYSNREKTPFRIDPQTKSLTFKNINGLEGWQMLINHDNILHIVGFIETGKGGNIMYTQVMQYSINGQSPHEEISKKEGIQVHTDLSNLTLSHMDMIFCMSGILYVINLTDEIIKYFHNKVFIYHIDCNFMNEYINGLYPNECYAVIVKTKEQRNIERGGNTEFGELSNGAKIDIDYTMIPVNVEYYSPTESGYTLLESKSFGTRRGLHIAKRFAIDCITSNLRTFNTDGKDGTLDCDYEECRYTCSSSVLTDRTHESRDSYLYHDQDGHTDHNKVYWSNYEILYSHKIIEECKERIIKMFANRNEIKLLEIYREFLIDYKREYFINMAIYGLAIGRYKVTDSFGFDCYITKGIDSLFLTRDFPEYIENGNRKIGKYVQKLIAITSDPDYRKILNVDDNIIDDIEKIEVKQEITKTELINVISYITVKLSEFKVYSSVNLIERCLGRIAYNTLVKPEFRKIEYSEKSIDQIICGSIFPIRCFSNVKPDGSVVYFHNQPDILVSNRQGEIAGIKNASGRFRIFYLQDGNPMWRNATNSETKDLTTIAVNIIKDKINQTITINIDGEVFVSKYHVSFYNGTFRFVNDAKGPGQDFSTLDNREIISFISWAKTSTLMKIPENFPRIQYIESLINQSGKREDKTKKIERSKAIINFFKLNRLIVKYSVMPDDDSSFYDLNNDESFDSSNDYNSQYPMQPGQYPMQPTQYPMQPTQYPMQPTQPTQYPMQPMQPTQPTQYPMQPIQPTQYPIQPVQPEQDDMQPPSSVFIVKPKII